MVTQRLLNGSAIIAALLVLPLAAHAAGIELIGPALNAEIGDSAGSSSMSTADTGDEIIPSPVWIMLPEGFAWLQSVGSMQTSNPRKVAGIASYAHDGRVLFVPVIEALEPGGAVTLSGLGVRAGSEGRGSSGLDITGVFIPDAVSGRFMAAGNGGD